MTLASELSASMRVYTWQLIPSMCRSTSQRGPLSSVQDTVAQEKQQQQLQQPVSTQTHLSSLYARIRRNRRLMVLREPKDWGSGNIHAYRLLR